MLFYIRYYKCALNTYVILKIFGVSYLLREWPVVNCVTETSIHIIFCLVLTTLSLAMGLIC